MITGSYIIRCILKGENLKDIDLLIEQYSTVIGTPSTHDNKIFNDTIVELLLNIVSQNYGDLSDTVSLLIKKFKVNVDIDIKRLVNVGVWIIIYGGNTNTFKTFIDSIRSINILITKEDWKNLYEYAEDYNRTEIVKYINTQIVITGDGINGNVLNGNVLNGNVIVCGNNNYVNK